MFNALVMSYSRLPLAMAQDGMLPKVFGKLHPKSRAPWVAILALAIGWGLALNLGFERLVTLDIMIYGASLLLEFVALICLRIREPELKRPFRVPGGLFGAIAVGIPPVLLLGFAIVRSEHEVVLGMSSFLFAAILIGAGVFAYLINHALKPAGGGRRSPRRRWRRKRIGSSEGYSDEPRVQVLLGCSRISRSVYLREKRGPAIYRNH